jgi:hypothetical protein
VSPGNDRAWYAASVNPAREPARFRERRRHLVTIDAATEFAAKQFALPVTNA